MKEIKYYEILEYLFWIQYELEYFNKKYSIYNKCTQLDMHFFQILILIIQKSLKSLKMLILFRNQYYLSPLFSEICSELIRFGSEQIKQDLLLNLIIWFRKLTDHNDFFVEVVREPFLSIIAEIDRVEKTIFLSFHFCIQFLKRLSFHCKVYFFKDYFLQRLIAIFYSKRHEYEFCTLLQKILLFIHKKTRQIIFLVKQNRNVYEPMYFNCQNEKCYTFNSKSKKNIGFSHWIKYCFLCNIKLHNLLSWNISEKMNIKKKKKYYDYNLLESKLFEYLIIRNIICSYIIFVIRKGDIINYIGLCYKKNSSCKVINVHSLSCRVKLKIKKKKNYENICIGWHDTHMKYFKY